MKQSYSTNGQTSRLNFNFTLDISYGKVESMIEYQPGQIVTQCIGCERIVNGICKNYAIPWAQWRRGNCPMNTHIKKVEVKSDTYSVNPLKASKRSVAGIK